MPVQPQISQQTSPADPFTLTGSVGPEGENRREDVIKTQIMLGNTGDFDLAALGAPTGWPSGALWRGIKAYQKRKGLTSDGTLLPLAGNGPDAGVDENGRSETLAALSDDLGSKLAGQAVPTPQEVDRHFDRQARFGSQDSSKEEPQAADAIIERGQVLPIGRMADGRTTWAVPQMLRDAYEAVTLPGDVWAGRVDPQSEEGFARTMNLAQMMVGGRALGRAAQRHIPDSIEGNVRASRSAGLYNPPKKPPRPFEADYPDRITQGGAQADEAGKLATDIEGRPLVAEHVAGRRALGEGDVGLSPADIRAVGGRNGATYSTVPAGRIGGDAGRVIMGRSPETGAPESRIAVSQDLSALQAERVEAHETAHLIDEVANQIPITGLNAELRSLYNTLNTGRERTSQFFGPTNAGYKGEDVPREFMAEAIRAYMADPNYIKTVAPKTAAIIRKFVNDNPKLKQIIQFNTVVGAVGLLTEDDDKP